MNGMKKKSHNGMDLSASEYSLTDDLLRSRGESGVSAEFVAQWVHKSFDLVNRVMEGNEVGFLRFMRVFQAYSAGLIEAIERYRDGNNLNEDEIEVINFLITTLSSFQNENPEA